MPADILPVPSEIKPTSADPESLGDEIATLCSCIYAAEARLLERLQCFDAGRCFESLGFHSTAHWLNYRCGIGMNAAREKVRVANALPALPKIRGAFAAGRLSYSKVRAMTRVATAGNEDYLLSVGMHGTAHHVEKLVSQTRRAERLKDEVTAEAVYSGRELSLHYDESGAMVLKGRFPAEQGALILKALEMAMDEAFAPASSDEAGSDAAANDADDTSVEPAIDNTAETSGRVAVSARRADALAAIAETFLNNPAHAGTTADRYQVTVHVTAETSDDVTAVTSHLDCGPCVTAETSRRLACDCSVVPIREDVFGEPLSVGRKTRTIPPALRRALEARDGGCRFPGCTHSRFVDGHHIVHWANGGETSLENLVLLCRQHHRLVHEGGFGCERDEAGSIVFTDHRQRPIPEAAPLAGIEQDLDAWLDRYVFENSIDQQSCRARMDATDRMDWDMAVGALSGFGAAAVAEPDLRE